MTSRDKWSGARLRSLRKKHHLTQRELAELSDIDRSRYNALENGRETITLTYAERLAPHLDVTAAELLPPRENAEAGAADPLALLEELREAVSELTAEQAVMNRELAALVARVQKLEGQREARAAEAKSPQSRSAR